MNWPLIPLGELAEVVGGSTPSRGNSAFWGSGYYWTTPTDLPMPGDGILELKSTRETITDEGLRSSSANLLPVGTVLFSTRATIGKLAIAQVPVATNQGFNNFIAGPAIYNRFLAYALQYFTPAITRLAGSTTFKEVSRTALKAFRMPLPPLSEQRRIVEILDEADRIRKLRREADQKAERILPALFLKMFGDPATNPKGWNMSTLGNVADELPEYGANASACPMSEGKPRYIRITDIRDDGTLSDKEVVSLDAIDWYRYLLSEGDVLFARSGNTVGKTYIYRSTDGCCAFAGYLIRFKFSSGTTDPWFIFGLMRSPYYKSWIESHKRVAGQPNINGKEYASLQTPLPPLPFQRQFAEHARAIKDLLEQTAITGERLDSLFSILMQRAFSGQLTAKWRDAHMKELLFELEAQARLLKTPESKLVESFP